jgi:hypothetical protein
MPRASQTAAVAVTLQPPADAPPTVAYRWDADTDILSATVDDPALASAQATSLELEGADGSWLMLDVRAGCIRSVEVAVWPDVQTRPTLRPPRAAPARVILPALVRSDGDGDAADVEVDVHLSVETDTTERTIHFRLGAPVGVRTVRIARDILLDVDDAGRLAGLWLLNVPPLPADP